MNLADKILYYILHFNFIVLAIWVILLIVFRSLKMTEASRWCAGLFVLNLLAAFLYVFFYILVSKTVESRRKLNRTEAEVESETKAEEKAARISQTQKGK